MRSKKLILSSGLLVSTVLVMMVFLGHGVAPSISIPDTVVCPARAGSTVSQDVTGNSFSNVMSWQLNITYDSSKVSVVSFTLGSSWNAVNHSVATKNATGSLVYGYTTLNAAVVSGTTTLVTITWKFLVSPGSTSEHIVQATENSDLGAMLLDSSLTRMGYTTIDGGLTIYPNTPCPQSPSP